MQKGAFISVEGAEGVGKSSFCQNLKLGLAALGQEVLLSREPGGTKLADRIRSLFADPPERLEAISELFLVNAARCQHVNLVIRPSLDQGRWVITDRFFDSTYVYQGALGGIPASTIDMLTPLATGGLEPDVTFLLDADITVTAARLKNRDHQTQDGAKRFDEANEATQSMMRQAFLQLAQRWSLRYIVLDASKSPQALVQEAIQHLRSRGFSIRG